MLEINEAVQGIPHAAQENFKVLRMIGMIRF
jgi:hypothetical protein